MRSTVCGRRIKVGALVGVVVLLCLLLAGCSSSGQPADPGGQAVVDQASTEATAIVQQAKATALVANARATARALQGVTEKPDSADAAGESFHPTLGASPATPGLDRDYTLPAISTRLPAAGQTALVTPLSTPVAAQPPGSPDVHVLSVGYGADGAYIVVNFTAPPVIARRWMQGTVYVVDEATGTKYAAIPAVPILGPLFGRPKVEGQSGYVMLENRAPEAPDGLPPGSLVTVVLGEFKQQHVPVK